MEDVSDLCSRMAILDQGQLLFDGAPREAIEKLAGKVWTRTVDRDQLPAIQAEYQVLSTHLSEGRTVAHVMSDQRPGPEYEPVEADLKDVYFATLGNGAAAAEAA